MGEPAPIEPETKDWTVVVTDGCSECGFDPHVPVPDIGSRLRTTIPQWSAVLARPDATVRPQPTVWSPLEYACHVRDVCRVFRERLDLMRAQDDPPFPDWDQDGAAVRDRYFAQDPATVVEQYADEAEAAAAAFDSLMPDEYGRPGRRSNGSTFTIETLGVYFLHDIEHHVHDVTGSPR